MVRQVPTQFLEVVPRSSDRCSRPARIAQFASPFVIKNLQIAFPATPILSHLYKTLGGCHPTRPSDPFRCGVSVPARSPLPSVCQVPSFQQVAASCTLLPLFLDVASFRTNNLQPLPPKCRGWGGGLLSQYARIPKGQTSFRLHEVPSTSQVGSQDVRAGRPFAQRRRRLHIQLSLLQARGSQVHG